MKMINFLRNKIKSSPTSRKWVLVLLVVILATIGCFIPPMLSVLVFGFDVPLVILSGTEYVSILTLVVSIYFGANVWQKKIEGNLQNDVEENNGEEEKEV